MTKRILITMSEEQLTQLAMLMKEDLQLNRTAYVNMLITQEAKRREAAKRRPIGRPKEKDDADDEVRDIPNPNPMDAKARPFLTKSEHEAIQALRGTGV